MVIKNKTKLIKDLPTVELTIRDMEQKEAINPQINPQPSLTHGKSKKNEN